MTGTRRNRAVERTHCFLDARDVSPRDPTNYFWMYGAYEYRLQTPHDEAKAVCFRMIDRLVEKIRTIFHDAPPLNDTSGDVVQRTARATSLGGVSDSRLSAASGGAQQQQQSSEPKAHLILDIISTKKHIGATPEEGLPYRLGHDIYRYVDTTYHHIIATTFVGLTDNTARRVGRDVYYTKSDDLSRTHYGFHTVDREHLHIIFPPNDSMVSATRTAGGGSRGAATRGASQSPQRTSTRK